MIPDTDVKLCERCGSAMLYSTTYRSYLPCVCGTNRPRGADNRGTKIMDPTLLAALNALTGWWLHEYKEFKSANGHRQITVTLAVPSFLKVIPVAIDGAISGGEARVPITAKATITFRQPACECGAVRALGAQGRGRMHSRWCPLFSEV